MGYYAKRRLVILFFFLLIISLISYFIYWKYFKVYPTCFDNIQNQNEEDVDCGGPCKKICTFKAEKVNIDWFRYFEVIDGVYNLAGVVENPNFYYSLKIKYEIRYLNKEGRVIGIIRDHVKLEPLEKRVLFYPGIRIKGQKIDKVTFNYTNIYDLKQSKPLDKKIIVKTKEITENKDGLTRLKLVIHNSSLVPQSNLLITAVLINEQGNAIDLNQTLVENIDSREDKELFLTWRRKIEDKISRIDVYVEKENFDKIEILE